MVRLTVPLYCFVSRETGLVIIWKQLVYRTENRVRTFCKFRFKLLTLSYLPVILDNIESKIIPPVFRLTERNSRLYELAAQLYDWTVWY